MWGFLTYWMKNYQVNMGLKHNNVMNGLNNEHIHLLHELIAAYERKIQTATIKKATKKKKKND